MRPPCRRQASCNRAPASACASAFASASAKTNCNDLCLLRCLLVILLSGADRQSIAMHYLACGREELGCCLRRLQHWWTAKPMSCLLPVFIGMSIISSGSPKDCMQYLACGSWWPWMLLLSAAAMTTCKGHVMSAPGFNPMIPDKILFFYVPMSPNF